MHESETLVTRTMIEDPPTYHAFREVCRVALRDCGGPSEMLTWTTQGPSGYGSDRIRVVRSYKARDAALFEDLV